MPTRIEVAGLKQAGANFAKLGTIVQHEIGREALRQGAWSLVRKMRAGTYSNFIKRSGYIRSGLSVAVANDPKDNGKLSAWAVEYPQSIAGSSAAVKLFRSHMKLKGHRTKQGGGARVDLSGVAFYWRFLEFGTGPRTTSKTPTFLRTGKLSRSDKARARQLTRARAWQAAPSRGGIKSRSWLRPIFGGGAPDAITSFRETIDKLIGAAVGAMPKR